MLLYMYIASGQGQTTPWGQMLMSTDCPYHFAHLLQVLKQSLKYDFQHILNDFIHVYSPRAGIDNSLGTKFWCQQKFLITLPICCQFKKISLKSDFLPVFYVFYSSRQGQITHWDKNFMTTERPFLYDHMLQVSKWKFRNLILYTFLMILYMYIAPRQGPGLISLHCPHEES